MSDNKSLSPLSRARSFSSPRSGSWEDLFASLLGGTAWPSQLMRSAWSPSVDLIEREGELLIRADLPGMSHDDVTISVEEDLLTISGERETVSSTDESGVHRLERSYGSFSRTVQLPRDAAEDEITARFERGVLEITIPRTAAAESERVIEIEDGGE